MQFSAREIKVAKLTRKDLWDALGAPRPQHLLYYVFVEVGIVCTNFTLFWPCKYQYRAFLTGQVCVKVIGYE